ncbi:alpha/beta fold hydrolase [Luteibacter yeojuensis]|nr:alpha/beta hydrolase [Luteibacter yeojuensis]
MMRRRIAATTVALAAALAARQAAASTPHDIAWGTCPEAWVGTHTGLLGNRLQCATLGMPLDHAAPDHRRIDVGVVRIRAAVPAAREGAIFFNKGGPGAHPGRLMRSMGEGWTRTDAGDPQDGDKRRLAERFDLVAVIPRGLVGSHPILCLTGMPPRYPFLPTHLDDDTWQLVRDEAQGIVGACGAHATARFVNTEQHVHDMEAVRRTLGDERLHFYGISYGGAVGAWYASMYPTHTGRLLLDSSMDFTHDYRVALRLAMAARQAAFNRDVAGPVLRAPAHYGLDGDAAAVSARITGLPDAAREAWGHQLDTSARLAAALHLATWLGTDSAGTLAAMRRRIRQSTFTTDAVVDRQIRWHADDLARGFFATPPTEPSFVISPDGDAVRILTSCNDAPWTRTEAEMRESLARDVARFVDITGDETLEELTCSRWAGPSARAPDLSVLERAAPFLLIQSENDTNTPLVGGQFIVARFPNARMLLVRDSNVHGVFNFTNTGCVERTAARYLLTGSLPASTSRVFACDAVAGAPADQLPGTPRPPVPEPQPVDPPATPAAHDEF